VAHAREVAERKAAASKAPAGRVVLSADTVVHIDDELFEKPRDPAHAVEMLTRLSGRGHAVTTAVCVGRDGAWETLHCTTEVRFRALTLAEIAAYVATGDAADKAGAYGIQGRAGSFVTDVRGDYTNVIGLPLEAALGLLERYGLSTRTR
jgi:septum formation protein